MGLRERVLAIRKEAGRLVFAGNEIPTMKEIDAIVEEEKLELLEPETTMFSGYEIPTIKAVNTIIDQLESKAPDLKKRVLTTRRQTGLVMFGKHTIPVTAEIDIIVDELEKITPITVKPEEEEALEVVEEAPAEEEVPVIPEEEPEGGES